MTLTKTMPSTVEAGRIAELVRQIENAERYRDLYWKLADARIGHHSSWAFNNLAAQFDNSRDTARAELRAILGVDPYRLANAIGG